MRNRVLSMLLLAAAVAAACAPASAAPTIGKQDCLLVEAADIRSDLPAGLSEIETLHWQVDAGHRLKAGSHRVLVLRHYASEEGVADAQVFTKITAILDKDAVPGSRQLHLSHARFTQGYSGYAYRSDAWMTDDATIEVAPAAGSDGLLRITGSSIADNPNRRSSLRFDIDFKCPLKSVSVDALTPWQGGDGTSSSFFYPSEAARHQSGKGQR